MTDEQHGGNDTPEDTPWWSRSAGGAWDAPSSADAPAPPRPSMPAPDEPTRPLPPHAPDAFPGFGPPRPPSGGPGHPWMPPPDRPPFDTLGREASERRGPGTGLLLTLATVLALVAGVTGGAAGYLFAERQNGGVTVDGANLGAAPADSAQRPEGSVAGVAARVLPSVVQIKVETSRGQSTGSGFVIDDEGLIVTNNHVVSGAKASGISVSFSDGSSAGGTLVGTSASYDLAVLKVRARNLTPLPLGNSDTVAVGDTVIAVGSPLGLSGTVTSGIVSAKDRKVTAGDDRGTDDSAYINAVQTDAAINPGNSGGPLVDLQGRVIGVNSAIATVGGALGESGNIGVGFAIPINQVRRTAEQIIRTGKAEYPIIGASLDAAYAGEGARIAADASADGTPPIVPDGPADRAGLRPGDIILEIDGEPVEGGSELIVAIRSNNPGDTVRLKVRRDTEELTVNVTLGSTKG